MTKSHITLVDVRKYVEDHEIILDKIDGSPTILGGIAKQVARGLNDGKSPKQVIDRVQGFLVTIRGEQAGSGNGGTASHSHVGEDGVERYDDENTSGQHDLGDIIDAESLAEEGELDGEGDEAAEPEDDQPEDGGEASEEGEGDEDGEKIDRSVVKAKYRAEYKRRGDARICGDWLSLLMKGLTNGPKRKLDLECFVRICELNESGEVVQRYLTSEKRLTNGWQGRARMSGRLAMEQVIARNATICLPTPLWEACAKKVDELLEKGGLPQPSVEVVDDVVFVRAPDAWIKATLAKRPNANKKEKAASGTEAEAN